MIRPKYIVIFCLFTTGIFYSCSKVGNISPDIIKLETPDYFPSPTYPLNTNPLNEKGVKLGKQLFNEPLLSIDNSVACSNCHSKGVAFTDAQHNPSIGIHERVGTRNAPPIFNLAFRREFFWDGSSSVLDFVPLAAIENEVEMGETLNNVVTKLNDHKEYPNLFREVYPEADTITGPFLLKAISQYLLVLISSNSQYDQNLRGETELSKKEKRGEMVFIENCQGCHSGALFTSEEFKNNGLDTIFKDSGREGITEWPGDRGKFLIPSLRNIELTAPYMHDGRFETIREVLDFYDQNVLPSPTLAEELNENGELGIPLTEDQKDDLEAFLYTLTDISFIQNTEF